jgi:hypothetical protein
LIKYLRKNGKKVVDKQTNYFFFLFLTIFI